LLLLRNDAFNWRLALADHATTSIDAQYFIWQDEETGLLLFDHLLRAADRAVRVRLLVDDIWFTPLDTAIAAISKQPNFDIKIFNPAVNEQVNVAPVTAGVISLHVKALVGDRQRCFLGSLNLDPRIRS